MTMTDTDRLVRLEGSYEQIADRMNAHDGRFDTLERKIDAVRTDLSAKIEAVNSALTAKIDAKVDSVRTDLSAKIDGNFRWSIAQTLAQTFAILGAIAIAAARH